MLCPRRCGVNRLIGETGVCGETAVCRVASACLHHGEEPPISGTHGSGTVFFTGCSCGCFFCQNHQISREGLGTAVSMRGFLALAHDLIAQGAHNLNLVTPDHVWPHIRELARRLRADGVSVPLAYNCSGYTRPDIVPEVARWVDIFMPDVKFADPLLAHACIHAADYPDIAFCALDRMIEAKGFLEPFDPGGRGIARRGVLVRHLVLPGQVDNSLSVLRRLRREFGRMLPLSVMSQFQPMPECRQRGLLTRRVSVTEYDQVCRLIEELGFEQAFVQPIFDDDGYVPDFDRAQPFRGNTPEHEPRGGMSV